MASLVSIIDTPTNENSQNCVNLCSPSPVLGSFINQQVPGIHTPAQKLLFTDEKASILPQSKECILIQSVENTPSATEANQPIQMVDLTLQAPTPVHPVSGSQSSSFVSVSIDRSNTSIACSDIVVNIEDQLSEEVEGATSASDAGDADARRREFEESERLAWQLMQQEVAEVYNMQLNYLQNMQSNENDQGGAGMSAEDLALIQQLMQEQEQQQQQLQQMYAQPARANRRRRGAQRQHQQQQQHQQQDGEDVDVGEGDQEDQEEDDGEVDVNDEEDRETEEDYDDEEEGDEGVEEEEEEEEEDIDTWDYDRLLELGAQLGDVKTERWRHRAGAVIQGLTRFSYHDLLMRQEVSASGTSGVGGELSPAIEQIQKKSKLERLRSVESSCAVCMEPYARAHVLCELRCGHYFHEECTSQWLSDHNWCPLCKVKVTHSP